MMNLRSSDKPIPRVAWQTWQVRHMYYDVSMMNARFKRESGLYQMSIEDQIREKLLIGLEPERLDVINESALHAGHRSSPGTGESHFRVLVVSEKFAGKPRIVRHRMVNDLLAHELAGKVHALSLATYAPGERAP